MFNRLIMYLAYKVKANYNASDVLRIQLFALFIALFCCLIANVNGWLTIGLGLFVVDRLVSWMFEYLYALQAEGSDESE